MKHTKGPWTFNEDSYDKTISANGEIIVYDEGCFETEDGIANARLISCAPEMLEMLIETSEYIEMNPLNYIGFNSTLHKKIKEIIEKATGLKIEEVLSCTE